MGRRRLTLHWVIALGVALFGTAKADTITWIVMEVPPYFSYPEHRPPQTPAELGQHGDVDGLLRLLIAQMPSDVRHAFVETDLPRFEAMARHGDAVCSMFHLKTPERLHWLYFTSLMPPMESRDVHVIVRADELARFVYQGQTLRLADLLHQSQLLGLLPRDRNFGPRISALLQAAGDAAPKTVISGRGMQVLPMLRAGRMDYTLEYAATVAEYLRENPQGPSLVDLPIVEGRSTTLATAACSRSPAGHRAIELIDAAVRKLAKSPRRDALIKQWRGPMSTTDRERIKRYMDERAKGGPQIE